MRAYPADRPLKIDEAYERLDAYGRQYGRLPLLLLFHAAVPESFRAELLNLLKVNFLAHEVGADMTVPRDHLEALKAAIWTHEKGFNLMNDYYNGINLAFLLDIRAAEGGGENAIADQVRARAVRERVVEVCTRLLAQGIKGESELKKKEEEYWVRATLAEALLGLGNAAKSEAEFAVAKKVSPDPWIINTTEEQLAKLRSLQRPRSEHRGPPR
jgi:hypothetical protein